MNPAVPLRWLARRLAARCPKRRRLERAVWIAGRVAQALEAA